ncbi:MAG: DNA polymerase III subunit gamma/tau, partial [Rhodobacteraceae bacterium]|nr:DNA polymerase III subunit gamma/tau [Paracoccaceae bacterium]
PAAPAIAAAPPAGRAATLPAAGPLAAAAAPARAPDAGLARFAAFEDVLDLIRQNRDLRLLVEVETWLRLARYAPGRIEFEPAPGAPPALAATLAERLQAWTGHRWGVSVVASGGAPSLAEARAAALDDARGRARANPVVQAILAAFPRASVTDVRSLDPPAGPADAASGPGEDWDPFEET